MTIPAIRPYRLPAAEELPPNVVDWQPSPGRCALLIHDMQQHFVRAFPADAEPITEVLANITALRRRCVELGIPVIFTAQPAAQDPRARGLLCDFWGPGPADEAAIAIVPALAPVPGDRVLTKHRYSAFVGTDLAGLLGGLGRDQLLICGVYAHIGCVVTACDAFMRDIQPFLVADALGDFTRSEHTAALSYAARRCAAVLTTGQALDQFGVVGAARPVGGHRGRS